MPKQPPTLSAAIVATMISTQFFMEDPPVSSAGFSADNGKSDSRVVAG